MTEPLLPANPPIAGEDNISRSATPENVEFSQEFQSAMVFPVVTPNVPLQIVFASPALVAEIIQLVRSINDQFVRMEQRLGRMVQTVERVSQNYVDMTRKMNIGFNQQRDTAFFEITFLDGTLPSQAVAPGPGQVGRAALPLIREPSDLRALTGVQASLYLVGHGVVNPPRLVKARKEKLANIIGCKM